MKLKMKKFNEITIYQLIVLVILLAGCEKDTNETNFQETPINFFWKDNYQFEKTTPLDINFPEHVGDEIIIGNGTPESITRQDIQDALDVGGKIIFDTGGESVTVYIDQTLVVKKHGTVINGGGLITFDAKRERRLIYSVPAHHSINPNRENKTLNWMIEGIIFRNGKTTGGSLSGDAPNFNNNDGSGNNGQAGSGAAIWSGLWNQCFIKNCHFYDNQTKQLQSGEEVGGGAVYSRGGSNSVLVISDSYFENNKGSIGGAVNNLFTNLTITRSIFINNQSSDSGSAIYTDGGAQDANRENPERFIKIHASVFHGNIGNRQGGAVFAYVYGGTVTATECIFEKNECRSDGLGGALRTGNGYSEIKRCSFIGNLAYSQGGALWVGENKNYSSLIQNCTFYQNLTQQPEDTASGLGGAISVAGGPARIVNTTIAHNKAHQGAGVFGEAAYKFQNSIFSNNYATNSWGASYNLFSGSSFINQGGNIQWLSPNTSSDQLHAMQNVDAIDPLLESSLTREEGFTPVLRLKADSPAKGKGDFNNNAPSVDQLGKSRGERNDAGAYQLYQ